MIQAPFAALAGGLVEVGNLLESRMKNRNL
jgi:hypothetical protein